MTDGNGRIGNLVYLPKPPFEGKICVILRFEAYDYDRYRKGIDAVRPLVADIEILGEYKSFG